MAEEAKEHAAAKVLQKRQRNKVESRKPQWPMRLTIMALRAKRRSEDMQRNSITAGRNSINGRNSIGGRNSVGGRNSLERLKGDGVGVSNRLSVIAGGGGRGRAYDPRAGAD